MVKNVRLHTTSCTSPSAGARKNVSTNPPSTSMGARIPPRCTLSNIWWTWYVSLVSLETREEMEKRSIWAQDSRSTRLYRSPRRSRVTSMDTQAAMRLAVTLHSAAPQAITIISPPVRQIASRSPAGTQTSMI